MEAGNGSIHGNGAHERVWRQMSVWTRLPLASGGRLGTFVSAGPAGNGNPRVGLSYVALERLARSLACVAPDLLLNSLTMMDRRRFLQLSAAAVAVGPYSPSSSGPPAGRAPLRVLILGGTGFLGPSIVEHFRASGHTMTLFNRGRTNPGMFPDLERLLGDREREDGRGYEALGTRTWDVVVDTWQRAPQCVLDAATLLSGRVSQYQYVSSISVYRDISRPGVDESAPVRDDAPFPSERTTDLPYAVRKSLSEAALAETLPGRHAIFRSHGMRGFRTAAVGDEPYWPVRIARGGEVLAPGDGSTAIQFTDIVGLCRFMRHCAQEGLGGTYNVATPRGHTLAAYLNEIVAVTESGAAVVWVPREFLAEHDITPYRDLPMWRPEPAGFYGFDVTKAIRAGLETRALAEPIRDMLAGYRHRHPADRFQFGVQPHQGTISMETEVAVLAAWRNARDRAGEPSGYRDPRTPRPA